MDISSLFEVWPQKTPHLLRSAANSRRDDALSRAVPSVADSVGGVLGIDLDMKCLPHGVGRLRTALHYSGTGTRDTGHWLLASTSQHPFGIARRIDMLLQGKRPDTPPLVRRATRFTSRAPPADIAAAVEAAAVVLGGRCERKEFECVPAATLSRLTANAHGALLLLLSLKTGYSPSALWGVSRRVAVSVGSQYPAGTPPQA